MSVVACLTRHADEVVGVDIHHQHRDIIHADLGAVATTVGFLCQLRGKHARVTVGGDHADAPNVLHAHHIPEPIAAKHKSHVDVGRHRVGAHFGHCNARAGAVSVDRDVDRVVSGSYLGL